MAATLLLADDSITIQRVIELTFADEHIRVIAAADGQQAIQRIDHEPPDIILADVGMPKIDGYGVATYVKQNPALKHIPVLLLTGAFEPIDEAKARATGCEGVLVKPFEPEKLIARVKELLDGARHADLWPADLPRVDAVTEPAPVVRPAAPPSPTAAPAFVRQSEPVAARQAAQVVVRTPAAAPPPPPPAPVAVPPVELRPVEIREAAPTTPSRPAPQAAGPVFLDTPNHAMPRTSAPARQQPPRAPELPPPADAFESELDMLDVALSRLEPTATPQELDAATASDFARDLATLRNVGPEDAPATERTTEAAPSFGNWDLAPRRTAPPEPMMDLGIDLEEHEPIDVVPVELPADVVPQSVAPVPALAAVPEPAVILPPPAPAVPVVTAPVVPPAPAAPPAPVPLAMRMSEPAVVTAPPATVAPPVVTPAPARPVAPRAAAPAAPVLPPSTPKPTLAGAFSALLAAERAQPVAAPAPAPAAAALSEAAVEDVVKRVLARMTDDTVQRVVLDAAERIIREEIERLKSPDAAKPR